MYIVESQQMYTLCQLNTILKHTRHESTKPQLREFKKTKMCHSHPERIFGKGFSAKRELYKVVHSLMDTSSGCQQTSEHTGVDGC